MIVNPLQHEIKGCGKTLLSLLLSHSSLLEPPSSSLLEDFLNKPDKRLQILEEFKNKNHLAANLRVLRVHLSCAERQYVISELAEVCNKIGLKVLP